MIRWENGHLGKPAVEIDIMSVADDDGPALALSVVEDRPGKIGERTTYELLLRGVEVEAFYAEVLSAVEEWRRL
jgi:hypothetical protein